MKTIETKPRQAVMHGRGALENPTGRFEKITSVPEPDGWEYAGDEEDLEPLKTEYFRDNTKSIISFNDSPDIGFDASLNPYRGCEHGCIYCYARPTHEYLGLSAGLDFETKVFVKMDAAKLLREKLQKPSWEPMCVAISGITDPYQPAERRFQITRQCLEVFAEFRNPVGLITKNYLITRDIDVLSELAKYNCVRTLVSVTSLDDSVARVMEPRASAPQMRLKAIRQLSEAGIPVGVMMGPIVPGLTDHEIAGVLEAAAEAGARYTAYTILRLPYGIKDLFQTWLDKHFPMRKNKILSHVKNMRGGKLNDPRFGHRMHGEGEYAETIHNMMKLYKKRYGLSQKFGELSLEHFRRDSTQQLQLF